MSEQNPLVLVTADTVREIRDILGWMEEAATQGEFLGVRGGISSIHQRLVALNSVLTTLDPPPPEHLAGMGFSLQDSFGLPLPDKPFTVGHSSYLRGEPRDGPED